MSDYLDIEPFIEECTEIEVQLVMEIIVDIVNTIKNEHNID
jgi:hypothetical protein